MDVTVEGWGRSLNFLESELQFSQDLPFVSVKRPVFESLVGDSTLPAHARMFEMYSPNCRSMLKSFIPNAVRKSAWYPFAHAPSTFALNISNVLLVLLKKNYPSSWWRPRLFAKMSALDLYSQALFGIELTNSEPS